MISTHDARSATLDVPGAHLHYEVRGSGPVLLMIPGGAMDGASFAGIAPLLADRYTVVTYDPRGLGQSTLDGPPEDVPVEVYADDAHRLLASLGSARASVFTSSGGGLTGLVLAATHPEQVHTLVAHEPPITELLPDGADHRAEADELYEIWRTQGVGAALAAFMAAADLDGGEDTGPPDPEMAAWFERMQPNFDFFFGYMMRPMAGFRPDVAALQVASTRVVVGGGVESRGQVAHRTAVALAEVLGAELVEFPGDHVGFASEPDRFAEVLRRVLTTQ